MTKPVCLVVGVGSATGASTVRRFASEGFDVAMIARNDARLKDIEAEIGSAKPYACDVGDLDRLVETTQAICRDMGVPDVVVFNAVSESFSTFDQGDPATFERNYRVNATALLVLAQQLAPMMTDRGHGAIVVTSNTAALRGVPRYALFAPSKAAQRILAQALARDLGPKRIHVCCVIVDAAIDAAWLSEYGRVRPDWLEPPESWPFERSEYYAHPDAIADEIFRLTQQPQSAWSFESIIRPFAERW
jgi:NAD(P)-dependent dehydrogenase (short-subunit alcohol dehydrogenase family)